MNGTHWFKLTALSVGLVLGLSACQKDVVHQRSMAELNQKAQAMMQAGDVQGALARLESAHDLEPDEPNTTYNLGVAYQMQGNYDKALEMFSQVADKPGMDAAQIHKSMGITYEAKADALEASAKDEEQKPKPDASKVAAARQNAKQAFQLALDNYQQALGGLKVPADQQAIQAQIQALQAKQQHDADGGQTPAASAQ